MTLPLAASTTVPTTKFLASARLAAAQEIGLGTEGDAAGWYGLRAGPWTYTVRTIEGTYPHYRQVIPAVAGDSVLTFTDDNADLLRQVLDTFPGGDHITLVGAAGRVTLYGRNPDDAKWTTLPLDGSGHTGPRAITSVDRRFLRDALVAGFRVFALADDLSPVVSRDTKGGTHILMPRRGVVDPEAEVEPGPTPAAGTRPAATTNTEGTGQPSAEPPPVTEPTPPAQEPSPSPSTTRREKTMPKEPKNAENGESTDEIAPMDRVLAACEVARAKIREAALALSDLTQAVRDAAREQKAQARDVESARTALAKLQGITL